MWLKITSGGHVDMQVSISTVVIIQIITESYFFNGVKKAHKAKHIKHFWTFDHSVLGSKGRYVYCHVCLLVFSKYIWPNVYNTEEVIWGKDTLIVVLKVWSGTTSSGKLLEVQVLSPHPPHLMKSSGKEERSVF